MTEQSSLPPAFAPGNLAVVTGAASGIGLAACSRLARLGMKVALADLGGPALERAADTVGGLAGGTQNILACPTDVRRPEELERLRNATLERFGPASVLMNNAGVGNNPGLPWENSAAWKVLVDVNLWGVMYGVEAFVPSLLASGKPAVIINTGSKQGITSPPGNAAYNLSKAALRSYTEALAHALRTVAQGRVTAHLLIPGFTFTGLTKRAEKPAGAWTPEQVVDFMLDSVARGDFYILCPDNDVTRDMDERRMQWGADDLIKNRPALSRWHPDYKTAFDAFMKDGKQQR